jgi:ABC-2 type transport system permease protein
VLAYTLFFLLYIAILVYGQQVMIGVIEEKSSRIVEVIVATTRPFDLMMGKLIGICCVALTQLGIWMLAIVVFTLPPVVAQMAWISNSVDIPTLSPTLLIHFFLFFVLGFFLFSTFYGSVGAAFNNIQEAQQFASIGAIFAVAPMLLFWMVLNDPDSPLSVVASLIPFFTPLLMLLRLAVKAPPIWQVLLGYVLTLALTWAMIWVSARIYRVGILMYGKKPSLPEIWRWIRYA